MVDEDDSNNTFYTMSDGGSSSTNEEMINKMKSGNKVEYNYDFFLLKMMNDGHMIIQSSEKCYNIYKGNLCSDQFVKPGDCFARDIGVKDIARVKEILIYGAIHKGPLGSQDSNIRTRLKLNKLLIQELSNV